MNSSRIFKLSVVASTVLVTFTTHSALYDIEIVDPGLGIESYGSAVSPTGELAGDTRDGTDGLPFREEAPFGLDNSFTYQDYDDLERYCFSQLGYNTCENWANRQWFGINDAGGLEREREAFFWGYITNARGFANGLQLMTSPPSDYKPGNGVFVDNSNNVIVNKYAVDGSIIGTTSSGMYDMNGNFGLAYRERGFIGDKVLLPATTFNGEPVSSIVTQMGRTMAFDSFEYGANIYVVGSASVAPFDYTDSSKDYDDRDLSRCFSGGQPVDDPAAIDACQNFAFSTKGFVWNTASLSGVAVADWITSDSGANRDENSYMSSVRGVAVPTATGTEYDGLPVMVGYNSERDSDNVLMQAAIFRPLTDGFNPESENAWESVFIRGAEVEDNDGDYIYAFSKATDINDNLLVIGGAKRRGDKPENGAAANRLFVSNAKDDTPRTTFLSNTGERIFFKGSGGEAKAVNNYNEIVGNIDAESAREYNGKQRRRRAFIHPYAFEGTSENRRALFENRAWWIDDLTNDGNANGFANKFRIVDAADINDEGVIAATALYCAEGYDNTGHNSFCGGGNGVETVVAVKLTPTVDLDDPNSTAEIITRSVDQESVEREGGSIGWFGLSLLALFGWRRRG